MIEFLALANEFKRDQRTIAQYCDYLKYVFFLKLLYDLGEIKSFMRRYACRKGLVITRGEEEGSFAVQRGAEKSKRQVKILGRLNRNRGVRNLRNVVAHLHLNNSKAPLCPLNTFQKVLDILGPFY